jgi:hypothetical protein
MKITWQNIKESVNRLMFLDATEVDEFANSKEYAANVLEAANYALLELAKIFPLKGVYTFTQSESDEEGFNEYDILELSKEDGLQCFEGFDEECPLLISDEVYGWLKVQEVQILLDRYLYIKKNQAGTFKAIYKKRLNRITSTTENDFEMELESTVLNIMPLLMAYRVFKDDEPDKAVQYYNEYMQARGEIAQKKTLAENFSVQEGDYDGL